MITQAAQVPRFIQVQRRRRRRREEEEEKAERKTRRRKARSRRRPRKSMRIRRRRRRRKRGGGGETGQLAAYRQHVAVIKVAMLLDSSCPQLTAHSIRVRSESGLSMTTLAQNSLMPMPSTTSSGTIKFGSSSRLSVQWYLD